MGDGCGMNQMDKDKEVKRDKRQDQNPNIDENRENKVGQGERQGNV